MLCFVSVVPKRGMMRLVFVFVIKLHRSSHPHPLLFDGMHNAIALY